MHELDLARLSVRRLQMTIAYVALTHFIHSAPPPKKNNNVRESQKIFSIVLVRSDNFFSIKFGGLRPIPESTRFHFQQSLRNVFT